MNSHLFLFLRVMVDRIIGLEDDENLPQTHTGRRFDYKQSSCWNFNISCRGVWGFFPWFFLTVLGILQHYFCFHLQYDIEERGVTWKRICVVWTLCMITIKNLRGRCLFRIFRFFSSEVYCVEYQFWCWKSLFLWKFSLPELRTQFFSGLDVEVTQTLPGVNNSKVCHFADTTDLEGRKP